MFQHFLISNKFQILPDGFFQQPGKGIEPVQQAQQFCPKHINTMLLTDVHKLMPDDFLQLRFRMLPAVDENGVPE